jgi:ribosome-associated heat shock protein Hsp15
MTDSTDKVRIDKWLWAARFFKTRSMATDAVTGGKVEVNGERAKPAKLVQPGDQLRIRIGQFEHVLVVRDLGERRGPASVAATLYEETEDSKKKRAELAAQLRASPWTVDPGYGRPTKKDRRTIDRFRRKG